MSKTKSQSKPCQVFSVPVERLIRAPYAWRRLTPDEKESLRKSVKKNGQLKNLVVRSVKDDFEVIDGNEILEALSALKVDQAFILNLGEISDADAVRLSLELNSRHEGNLIELAKHVSSLLETMSPQELARTTNMKADELLRLQKVATFDWTTLKENVDESQTLLSFDE